jgi:hypothetical protein
MKRTFPVDWIPEADSRQTVREFAAILRDYCSRFPMGCRRPSGKMSMEFEADGEGVVFRLDMRDPRKKHPRPDEPDETDENEPRDYRGQ